MVKLQMMLSSASVSGKASELNEDKLYIQNIAPDVET